MILPHLLIPHRMDLIASIQLSLWYRSSNNPVAQSKHHEKWKECWRVVASMQGLRELWVNVDLVLDYHNTLPPLRRLLDPLRPVRVAEVFEVSMPRVMQEESMEFQDHPFVLKWYHLFGRSNCAVRIIHDQLRKLSE